MHFQALLASVLALSPLSASAITLSFEEGLSFGLGLGPVSVHAYTEDNSGHVVSIANATYIDTYRYDLSTGTYRCGSDDFCATSGRVAISPYLVDSHDGSFWGFKPINASFNFSANSVSIWAISPLGRINSSLQAYDEYGQLVGISSFTGLPSDQNSGYPYKVLLTVAAPNIRSIVIDGQYWTNGASGWQAAFDDLTVTPIPEPEMVSMFLVGLGIVGAWTRVRGKP